MRGMGLAGLLFALGLGCTAALAADAPLVGIPGATPEKTALALQIMAGDRDRDALQQTFDAYRDTYIRTAVATSHMTKEQATRFVDAYLLPEMKQRIGELTEMRAELFAARFSVQELQGIADFMRSPLGKKLIEARLAMVKDEASALEAWRSAVAKDAADRFAHGTPPDSTN